ncbi:hypothetical protein diail_4976 [Diaporthe ilicicola]|nr:hypothetical protein diail_4976 [Diaporthe ilicicola]
MSSTPVILIFGAGANTGLATAKKFAQEGYKVAAVSRNPSVELRAATDLIVPADLTDPKTVEEAFEKVTKDIAWHPPPFDGQMVSGANPITVSAARVGEVLSVSTISAYTAARLAVKGWASLPPSAAKAFFFPGQHDEHAGVSPEGHVLGMAKNATAYFIVEAAAVAYGRAGKEDHRLYYVDERREDGESLEGQSHWCWTVVKGDAARGEAGRYVRNKAAADRECRWMADLGLPDLTGLPEGGMSYREMVATNLCLKRDRIFDQM